MLQPWHDVRSSHAFLVLILVLAFGQDAGAEAISVRLEASAVLGKATPTLTVLVNEPVAALSVELLATDGTRLQKHWSKPARGPHHLPLSHTPGSVKWTGTLSLRLPSGDENSMPLSFETTLKGPPRLRLAPEGVDLEDRSLSLLVDRSTLTLELRVLSDEGVEIARQSEVFENVDPSSPRRIRWSQPAGSRVLRLDVRASDPEGFYSDLELYPWRIDVPHEDVLFASGRAEISAEEAPKLEAAWKELSEALAKYGRFAKVQLFVAGHTDTVGDPASNRSLSEARALSIARWFRKRGVRVPVHYSGLGEGLPLVPTPDETDEPRNRRAEYIVAVEAPVGVSWKKLP